LADGWRQAEGYALVANKMSAMSQWQQAKLCYTAALAGASFKALLRLFLMLF
jgi:hypothetical protein